VSNLLTYILAAAAGVLAIAFGFTTWQLSAASEALAQAHQELGAARTSLAQAVATARSNKASIDDLAGRLTQCVGQKQQVQEAEKAALAQAAKAEAQRGRALRQLTEAREKLYANDATCDAWGRAPVCGGVSGELRNLWERARGADADGGGGGAEDPVRGDRPDPAGDTGLVAAARAGGV
jgi:hypothetical protein